MIMGLITARILECQSEEVFSLKEGFLADKKVLGSRGPIGS